MHHLTPYHLFQGSTQPTVPVPSFNLPPALKTEANIAARTALLCNWCVDLGHFTHNCQDAHEWINAGRVIHGTDDRLYMPDGSNILCAPGGQCLRDGVEYTMSLQQSGQQPSQQPVQQSAKQSTQQPATTSTLLHGLCNLISSSAHSSVVRGHVEFLSGFLEGDLVTRSL